MLMYPPLCLSIPGCKPPKRWISSSSTTLSNVNFKEVAIGANKLLWCNLKALKRLLNDISLIAVLTWQCCCHNNIKPTSNANSCHISVVPSRINFKSLQGRVHCLIIRSLLLRSIFPNQSFTKLSITACKSNPVLFHLYIMTFPTQPDTCECASWGFQRQLTQSTISRAAQKVARLPGWFWPELPGPSAHRHTYCAAEEIKKRVI